LGGVEFLEEGHLWFCGGWRERGTMCVCVSALRWRGCRVQAGVRGAFLCSCALVWV
jgi:hypothetical protein